MSTAPLFIEDSFAGKGFSIRFLQAGELDARPLVFFHGFPGSRQQSVGLLPFLKKHNLQLIAPDRPGYGGTVGKGSAFDFVSDLGRLVKRVSDEPPLVVGVSGGSPWAHLFSSQAEHRVAKMAIVCGLCPQNVETSKLFTPLQLKGLRLRSKVPAPVLRPALNFLMKRFKPEEYLNSWSRFLGPEDHSAIQESDILEFLLLSMNEARLQGSRGILSDAKLYARDWLSKDCQPEVLRQFPKLYIHGERDRVLKPQMSKWMAESLPQSELQLFPNEGHYSLALKKTDMVLDWLNQGV